MGEFKSVESVDIDDDVILAYVKENYTPDEVFGVSELLYFVISIYTPDEVFTDKELEKWAKDNGYIEAGFSSGVQQKDLGQGD